VLQRPLGTGRDLAQVVRRDVRRHTDRDTGRAVDQQVREARRQDRRLLVTAVVVVLEVDGLLVDVPEHLHGQRLHLALGVPHGRGRVVARGAEVAVGVDQRHPHRPGLRQAHQGVVDRGVAVRVVRTHDVADDAGALVEALLGAVAAVVHRVQDAAVDGLEAVPDVRQRTRDDDGHRVVEVGALHLRFEPDGLDAHPDAFDGGGRALGGHAVRGHRGVLVGHGGSKSFRAAAVVRADRAQMSRKRTSLALRWMNERRASTSSPISTENRSSARAASSRET